MLSTLSYLVLVSLVNAHAFEAPVCKGTYTYSVTQTEYILADGSKSTAAGVLPSKASWSPYIYKAPAVSSSALPSWDDSWYKPIHSKDDTDSVVYDGPSKYEQNGVVVDTSYQIDPKADGWVNGENFWQCAPSQLPKSSAAYKSKTYASKPSSSVAGGYYDKASSSSPKAGAYGHAQPVSTSSKGYNVIPALSSKSLSSVRGNGAPASPTFSHGGSAFPTFSWSNSTLTQTSSRSVAGGSSSSSSGGVKISSSFDSSSPSILSQPSSSTSSSAPSSSSLSVIASSSSSVSSGSSSSASSSFSSSSALFSSSESVSSSATSSSSSITSSDSSSVTSSASSSISSSESSSITSSESSSVFSSESSTLSSASSATSAAPPVTVTICPVGINYYVQNRNSGRYVRAATGVISAADFTNVVDQTTTEAASVFQFVLDGDTCRIRFNTGAFNWQVRTAASGPSSGSALNTFSDDASETPPTGIVYNYLLCQAVVTTPPGSATLICSLPSAPTFNILADTGTFLRLTDATGAAIFYPVIPVYDLIPAL